MFITLTGELGSGKSTVCNILVKKFDYSIMSTGTIHRSLADRLNLTTLELNQKMMNDYSMDNVIDNEIVEIAKNNIGEKIIFDSRLAWHFVPVSFKVLFTVDLDVAGKRIFNVNRGTTEKYKSLEDATRSLKLRRDTENIRFKEIYSVDCDDFNNFNLIIDCTINTPREIAYLIMDCYKKYTADEIQSNEHYLSPAVLFPTSSYLSSANNKNDHLTDKPIKVFRYKSAYYIVDDHQNVINANKNNETFIKVNLIDKDMSIKEIKEKGYFSKVHLNTLAEWEDICSIRMYKTSNIYINS